MTSQVRCESIEDLASGKYYLEIYYPIEAETPFLTTVPKYGSHAEVEQAAVDIFTRAMPQHIEEGDTVTVDHGPFPELFAPKKAVSAKKFTPLPSLPFISLLRAARRPSIGARFFSQS